MTRALVFLATVLMSCAPVPDDAHDPDAHWSTWAEIAPTSAPLPAANEDTLSFQLGRGDTLSSIRFGAPWRLGQEYLLGFEVNIDPAWRQNATVGSVALLQLDRDSRQVIRLDLSPNIGLHMMRRPCVRPDDFGTWQRVYVRFRLDDPPRGYVEVRCGQGQLHLMPVIHYATDFGSGAPRFSGSLGVWRPSGEVLRATPPVTFRRLLERRLYVVFDRPRVTAATPRSHNPQPLQ